MCEREEAIERKKKKGKGRTEIKASESDKKVTGRKRHCCSGLGLMISPPSDGPLADIDDAVTNHTKETCMDGGVFLFSFMRILMRR